MQVQFTLEEEAQLARIAEQSGSDAEQLVRGAALRLVLEDLRFREGVQRGVAAADKGQFVAYQKVWANVQAILES